MAWLFLLAYWVAAVVIASAAYAIWNLGIDFRMGVVQAQHADGFDPVALAGAVLEQSVFEGDAAQVRMSLKSRGRTVGPARAAGKVGETDVSVAAGVITRSGHTEHRSLPRLRRGPLTARLILASSDPLGLIVSSKRGEMAEVALALPRFASLRAQQPVREPEAGVSAPRAGAGTEVFGVRPYQPGDPLRRIHWRSTARRGELIVREFEPPGVQRLGIFLDPNPPSVEAADQIARIAASEAWDCFRAGGRVTLWAPGCEPSRPDEERNLQALLEWLARYPKAATADEPPPMVGDAIGVTATSDARLLDAVEDVRAHGGAVRAWAVGGVTLESDIHVEVAGLQWPL